MANGLIFTAASFDNDAIDDFGAANTPKVYNMFDRWDGGTHKKKRITSARVITHSAASGSTDHDPCNVTLRWYDFERKDATNISVPGDYTSSRTLNVNEAGALVRRLGVTRQRSFLIDWDTGHGHVAIVKGLEIEYELVE